MRELACLFAVLLATGCGSRSRLLELGGTAGMSGSGGLGGTAGTSGSGGVGGGFGGNPSSCDELLVQTPFASVEHAPGSEDTEPALVATGDGSDVTVVFERAEAIGQHSIRHATFSPWQPWTGNAIAPVRLALSDPALYKYPVAKSDNGRFAMAPRLGGGLVLFAPEVDPNADGLGEVLPLGNDGVPLFAAESPPGFHLVGVSSGMMLSAHIVNGMSASQQVLACGLGVNVADAAPYQGGWLVAFANEPTAPPVGCSAAANGATRLDVVRVGADGAITPLTSVEGDTPIAEVSVAPHPKGAWVTWRTASGGVVEPIRYLRADLQAGKIEGPWSLSAPTDVPMDGLDTAALGDRLVVAWGNDPANNPPDLTVSVIENDALKTQAVIEPGFFGHLSVIGSPDERSVLVAWRDGEPVSQSHIGLARFDCLTGL